MGKRLQGFARIIACNRPGKGAASRDSGPQAGEDQMTPRRRLSRRSFLASVAGGSALAGGALLFVAGRAEAFQRSPSGCSDSDPIRSGGDPGNYGRRCSPATGVTDNDPTDPTNGGRRRPTGCSDGDRGRGSDPGGWGRRCRPATGITDNDPGDPTNGGRGYRNRQCNDSDSGSRADNAGQGRRC